MLRRSLADLVLQATPLGQGGLHAWLVFFLENIASITAIGVI